ncbi:acyl-CoA dehydrogenase family protein [Alcaligenes endophyticus]|uniref:Acyl-CoA dehydrogenase family protein n=1 Tax=Alcaligenes endophyticus TaxID=1929088 RepID=A0ABT8EJJ4_9BURK|nr:acyl-CoA dehydrogenase family protein [Alcaligenes endophyticus]MCX5591755.1 acyl-CoA dehydrogenase family protein [Alcaligenes endophyticus]MDN4121432.1 acyl-CoA dehydrogenase family protein [Alcaligenes endophyticus]
MTKSSATPFDTFKQQLRRFIDEVVIPRETWRSETHEQAQTTARYLQQQALAIGLGAPQAEKAIGGLGLNWEQSCEIMEIAGRSYLGPVALQCAPPIQPDSFVLEKLVNSGQRRLYLQPLLEGKRLSCFAMTEPAPGAGSDPQMLASRARRAGNEWVLDGHKWFITGAGQADFAIVVARTEEGVSWFLVDTDNPGFKLIRDIPTMEPFDMGGHGEIILENCHVPAQALLGEPGKGLDYAQWRLEGARLFHCMRFIGLASRAMDLAQHYVMHREAQGRLLGEHQLVQGIIADAHIKLYAARMMTRDVSKRLDQGLSIRHHSSMAKVYVAEAVYQVADSAVQLCGALGVSEDLPLSSILRMLRPFRIYDGASEVHRAAIGRRVLHKGLSA